MSTNNEKVKHMDFIYLTDIEYDKLVKGLGESRVIGLIEDLNNYIGSTGKKYKSHYFTILMWDRMDKKRKEARNPPQPAHNFKEVSMPKRMYNADGSRMSMRQIIEITDGKNSKALKIFDKLQEKTNRKKAAEKLIKEREGSNDARRGRRI